LFCRDLLEITHVTVPVKEPKLTEKRAKNVTKKQKDAKKKR